jgi:L-amino acid N-acyltransferase YncA
MIRSAHFNDATDIARIYNHYIRYSIATFEETVIDGNEMERRMQKVLPLFPGWSTKMQVL